MQEVRELLKKIIYDLYGLDFDPELTPSPDNVNADYSSNTPLKLAKEFHKNPMEIAKEMAKAAKDTFFKDNKESIFITPPGFINFTLPSEYLAEQIDKLADNFDNSIKSDEFENKTIICEFSDPNPFKVLHVGHLYTSIVGDAISRLFEYAGANVVRANFGGDVGLHVAKTMYALLKKPADTLTIEDIAKCYIEGTAAYEKDETAREEITKLNKEIYQINADGMPYRRVAELGGPPRSLSDVGENARTGPVERNTIAELYWRGRELSYDYFRDFYATIGVKFDKFYPESTVAALGLKTVKEQLKNGVYEMSDGAVIFDGDKYGLHTRVFINKEGIPTYETKDVGLIFTKWEDYHFDKSVVITGNEQKDYMSVVLKSIEQYAPELVERTSHLTHGLVKLPGNIKMSSRKGNFLKAVDVLAMVKEALKREYDSDDETVALAATKYAFIKYKMGGDIIFDPSESVKMTGNSGPYLLYSAVRAKKILSKAYDIEGEQVRSGKRYSDNSTDAEHNLMKKILEYKDLLAEAVTEMAPHKLANYLYELAQDFSRFYEHCEVIGSENESERLKLVKVYLDTMTHGLQILGINIPDSM